MAPLVKICGVTNTADALHVAACGADAIGLVFYAGSPRFVTIETAREICAALPPFITRVGLFVNAAAANIRETVVCCGLDAIQLHGDERPDQSDYRPLRSIKALRVKDADSLANHADYQVSTLLLDAWVPNLFGGSGKAFNWDLAAAVAIKRPIILAGGLTPENVAAAILAVRPYAVDVSSGVELAPGIKDHAKVTAFIRAVKGMRE
jgi:phosphoribosylanthranilate isomerase